jgi:hypothetical protein
VGVLSGRSLVGPQRSNAESVPPPDQLVWCPGRPPDFASRPRRKKLEVGQAVVSATVVEQSFEHRGWVAVD